MPSTIRYYAIDYNKNSDIELKKIDDDNCTFSIEFNGDLNPMIQMMVKTPLQSFINDLSANASSLV